MPPVSELAWQPSLLDEALAPAVDAGFTGLVRHHLDVAAWVDRVPGWLQGSDAVFAWLLETAPWHGAEVELYGRVVAEPRLTARWVRAPDTPLPHVLETMRAALSHRYEREFDSVGANLYRDGRDSVAWHGDRIARTVVDPLVATVSLGYPRRFLMRRRGGRATFATNLGHGDLLVMGGACQRSWQHSVPKVRRAGPRISLAFRHSR